MPGIAPEDIKLSRVQQEVMEKLADPRNLTTEEVALELGKVTSNVYQAFKGALKKLGAKELERRFPAYKVKEMIDYQLKHNPDKVSLKPGGQVLAARKEREKKAAPAAGQETLILTPKTFGVDMMDLDAAEAFEKLLNIAVKAGVPKGVIDSLATRIRRGMDEGEFMPEDYKDEDLYNELRQKIRLVISHIDHVTVGGAKLAELSTMFKTIMEQLQLLEGRPTAILGVTDQQNMDDIAQRFAAEYARRTGNTINGEYQKEDSDD